MDVCEEHGLEERSIECSYDFHHGIQATEELLQKYPDVDGIVASNDMVAISIIKVLKKHNISVLEQVQLVGFDDIELSSIITPELSTVKQSIDGIGKKAIELLVFESEAEEEHNNYVFPVTLITRETTRRKL